MVSTGPTKKVERGWPCLSIRFQRWRPSHRPSLHNTEEITGNSIKTWQQERSSLKPRIAC